jgi:hypothetical protein
MLKRLLSKIITGNSKFTASMKEIEKTKSFLARDETDWVR